MNADWRRVSQVDLDIRPLTFEVGLNGQTVVLGFINPSTAENHPADCPSHHPLFFTLARKGIRIGEALALDWSNVDFNGKFLHIQRSY